jgi:TonB family protein
VLEFGKAQEEAEESPSTSILKLGHVERSPLRLPPSPPGNNGSAPNRSILGLEGLSAAPLCREALVTRPGDSPRESVLGLSGLAPAPFVRRPPAPGSDGTPPNTSLLGLDALAPAPLAILRRGRPAPRPRPPSTPAASPSFFGLAMSSPARREAASRSFFGLEGAPYAGPLAVAPFTAPGLAEPAEVDVPEFEKDVDHRAEPAFPRERAILASLVVHALLLLLILKAPSSAHDPSKGLLAALVPPPKADDKIPVIFREAPGPERANPKKSDLSDADRRAGGGDPSRKKADSPFVAERRGKEGLAPGPRRPPSRPAVPPPGAPVRQAEARPQGGAPGAEKTQPEKPSEQVADALILPKPQPKEGSPAAGGAAAAPTLQGLNQAIKDAAKGVAPGGEDGSGFPNPNGGFVDSGPLSFDTSWYDWGPYAAEMIRRIKLHWDVPELARLGWKGRVTIRFYIRGDGRVEGTTILSKSSVPPFDYAAFQAITTSSPFRPLPKDLNSDKEGVTVTFFYNIRPGEEGGGSAH